MKKTNKYGLGYGKSITAVFSERRVRDLCSYLMPHINSGMKILDVGCGPGSLTADFAEIVTNKGSVVGVDIDKNQLHCARALSQKRGLDNATFKLADIMNLPFEDDTFDISHVSGVLCQIKDSLSGLKELKRVTKPGGIVAAREPIFECYIIYPDNEVFKESIKLATLAVNALDSDFNLGKKLKTLFNKANFSKVSITVSCETQATQTKVKNVCDSLLEDWRSSPWSQYIQEHKLVDKKMISQYLKATLDFSEHPDAFLSIPWGQAIGWV